MRVGQHRCAAYIRRFVKDRQTFITIALHFKTIDADMSCTGIPLAIFEDHLHLRRKVTEIIGTVIGLFSN